MDLDQLGNIGDAIGGLAIIGTLLYVVIELRLNTRTARASAASQSNQDWASLNETIIADPELIKLGDKIFDSKCDVASLSPAEKSRANYLFRAIMQIMESQYFLHEAGVLPKSVWENRRVFQRSYLDLPAWRDWWEVEKLTPGYTKEFIENIESAQPLALDRYNRFSCDYDA